MMATQHNRSLETMLQELLKLYEQYKTLSKQGQPDAKRAPRALTIEEQIANVNPYYGRNTSKIHAKW